MQAKRVRGLPLESLDLANNRIQIVQKRAFAGLKKLKVLNLNKNKISGDVVFIVFNKVLEYLTEQSSKVVFSMNSKNRTPMPLF